MRLLLSLVSCLLFFSTANAGVLENLFNEYASLPCINVKNIDMDAIVSKMAMPSSHPKVQSSYPAAARRFIKGLPQKYKLNKKPYGKDGMDIYYYQPSPTSNAETIMIVEKLGMTFVVYTLYSPKDGKELKESVIKEERKQ